jgi:hypothetical protein
VAIFHLSVKTISRSKGRSSTAAAAYRAGAKIVDSRTGEIHDYRRRSGVLSTFMVAPSSAAWAADREALWNAAEAAEKRINSTVAREYEIALPAELDAAGRRDLAARFAKLVVDRFNVAADVAIHEPSWAGDERNFHAHILTTTRAVAGAELGPKTRILDSATTGAPEIEQLRADWAKMANEALKAAGQSEKIDHRSRAAQKLVGPPTKHLGPDLTAVERRRRREARQAGRAYEPGSRRARFNLEARQARRAVIQARRELREAEVAEAAQAHQAVRPAPAAAPPRPAPPPGPASVAPPAATSDRPVLLAFPAFNFDRSKPVPAPARAVEVRPQPNPRVGESGDWTPAKVPAGRTRGLMGSIADMTMTMARDPAKAELIKPILLLAWRELGILTEKFRPWLLKMIEIRDTPIGRESLTKVIASRIAFRELRRDYEAAGLLRPPAGRSGPGAGRRDGPER